MSGVDARTRAALADTVAHFEGAGMPASLALRVELGELADLLSALATAERQRDQALADRTRLSALAERLDKATADRDRMAAESDLATAQATRMAAERTDLIATLAERTAERDRARDIAVALEQENAVLRAALERVEREDQVTDQDRVTALRGGFADAEICPDHVVIAAGALAATDPAGVGQ